MIQVSIYQDGFEVLPKQEWELPQFSKDATVDVLVHHILANSQVVMVSKENMKPKVIVSNMGQATMFENIENGDDVVVYLNSVDHHNAENGVMSKRMEMYTSHNSQRVFSVSLHNGMSDNDIQCLCWNVFCSIEHHAPVFTDVIVSYCNTSTSPVTNIVLSDARNVNELDPKLGLLNFELKNHFEILLLLSDEWIHDMAVEMSSSALFSYMTEPASLFLPETHRHLSAGSLKVAILNRLQIGCAHACIITCSDGGSIEQYDVSRLDHGHTFSVKLEGEVSFEATLLSNLHEDCVESSHWSGGFLGGLRKSFDNILLFDNGSSGQVMEGIHRVIKEMFGVPEHVAIRLYCASVAVGTGTGLSDRNVWKCLECVEHPLSLDNCLLVDLVNATRVITWIFSGDGMPTEPIVVFTSLVCSYSQLIDHIILETNLPWAVTDCELCARQVWDSDRDGTRDVVSNYTCDAGAVGVNGGVTCTFDDEDCWEWISVDSNGTTDQLFVRRGREYCVRRRMPGQDASSIHSNDPSLDRKPRIKTGTCMDEGTSVISSTLMEAVEVVNHTITCRFSMFGFSDEVFPPVDAVITLQCSQSADALIEQIRQTAWRALAWSSSGKEADIRLWWVDGEGEKEVAASSSPHMSLLPSGAFLSKSNDRFKSFVSLKSVSPGGSAVVWRLVVCPGYRYNSRNTPALKGDCFVRMTVHVVEGCGVEAESLPSRSFFSVISHSATNAFVSWNTFVKEELYALTKCNPAYETITTVCDEAGIHFMNKEVIHHCDTVHVHVNFSRDLYALHKLSDEISHILTFDLARTTQNPVCEEDRLKLVFATRFLTKIYKSSSDAVIAYHGGLDVSIEKAYRLHRICTRKNEGVELQVSSDASSATALSAVGANHQTGGPQALEEYFELYTPIGANDRVTLPTADKEVIWKMFDSSGLTLVEYCLFLLNYGTLVEADQLINNRRLVGSDPSSYCDHCNQKYFPFDLFCTNCVSTVVDAMDPAYGAVVSPGISTCFKCLLKCLCAWLLQIHTRRDSRCLCAVVQLPNRPKVTCAAYASTDDLHLILKAALKAKYITQYVHDEHRKRVKKYFVDMVA